jgi:hypothetical protein
MPLNLQAHHLCTRCGKRARLNLDWLALATTVDGQGEATKLGMCGCAGFGEAWVQAACCI